MQQALDVPRTNPAATPPPEPTEQRSGLEMIGDLLDLVAGAVAAWMPFLLLSMPGIVLFVIFPLMLAVIPAVLVALLAAPPYLIFRLARRWAR